MPSSPAETAAEADRPFAASSWEWTLACGILKIAIAALALALPAIEGHLRAPSVGWMLLAGGLAEFALGWGAHRAILGKVALGSGLLTVLAGILFIYSGWKGLFPLTSVTMVWLLLRGIISLELGIQAQNHYGRSWLWLVLRGITDLGLGLMLMIGIPMATIAILIFHETHEAVSRFGILLAISFAVAGIGLVAMAFSQRRREAALRHGTDSPASTEADPVVGPSG
jgi:uncharacterized membrane protein HdeD (DUF308 family)